MPYVIRNWKVSKRYADFERDPQYTTKHTGKIKYIFKTIKRHQRQSTSQYAQ